jgi:hypothetical protein
MALGGLVFALSSAERLAQSRSRFWHSYREANPKGEPAYGALGGRHVGTLHHLVVGLWCVAGFSENGKRGVDKGSPQIKQ